MPTEETEKAAGSPAAVAGGAARTAVRGDRAAAGAGPADAVVVGMGPLRVSDVALAAADGAEPEGSFRHAYSRDQATLIRRLRRIEGQVRGIERMIERREYCVDILQQTAALRAAVDSVALLILEDHVQGCVKIAAEQGDADRYIEEVLDVVRRTLGKPVRPRV
jgi:CsoR family transcriptional regulator, copper-sensing transcriptional repressor